ncbi:MAG: phospholipase D-like domain-containing protein [archaeon]|nr:phospholipase D-like domain-containing protein [archaeon]
MNKKTVTVILVLLTLSSALALEGESTDSVTVTGLLITEVSPADEAVTLTNIGGSRVDLGDYTLTDGEGTLSFGRGYGLDPGHSVTVSKESGTDWFNSRDGTITFSSPTIAKSGSFILADSGDEVILKKGGQVVDSVCYGKSNGVEGWTGPAVSLKSGQYLLRTHDTDSDTFSDWVATKPGWTNLEPSSGEWFEAVVHPFSFPESRGDPVFAAIMSAEHTVDISIYLLSSPELVALLCQMESRGVEVRVMVEGRPLGVDTSTELSLMKSLTDAGGEVRVINPPGGSGGRYTYVHNKYAVIDSETVVITSENWTSGNMGEHGNRG